MEWVVNATSRPLYSRKEPVPIVQEAGWAPGRQLHKYSYTQTVFKHDRKTAKSKYWFRHVWLSVLSPALMEHLRSHWTDFYEIRYLSIFRKCFIKASQE
jgi:hypothetical protein